MTLTLDLSETLKEFIQTEEVRNGYIDAAQYVAAWIAETPTKATLRELESSLRDGLGSPSDSHDHRRLGRD